MSMHRGITYEFVDTTGTFYPPQREEDALPYGCCLIPKSEGTSFKECAESAIDNWLEDHPWASQL